MKKVLLSFCAVMVLFLLIFFVYSRKEIEPADNRPTVRLVTDATGFDDRSFNAAAWRGILLFYGDTWKNQSYRGKLYDVVPCSTKNMYSTVLTKISDGAYDLICVTDFLIAENLPAVAKKYPDQKYMVIDIDSINMPNVAQFIFDDEQGAYLVGVVSALQAKKERIENPCFGFIGGVASSTITKFEVGYVQGIKSILPQAKIVDFYTDDWGAPEVAKQQAKIWYDQGVFSIFSAAGASGNGTIAQAKECRLNGLNVWAVGVDSDQYEDGIYNGSKSVVLTSMLKRVDVATEIALRKVQNKTFTGGTTSFSVKEGCIDFSISNPELSKDIIDAANDIKKEIISGNIKVFKTYKDALKAEAVPEGLLAIDE